jgi:hypothetical protein
MQRANVLPELGAKVDVHLPFTETDRSTRLSGPVVLTEYLDLTVGRNHEVAEPMEDVGSACAFWIN